MTPGLLTIAQLMPVERMHALPPSRGPASECSAQLDGQGAARLLQHRVPWQPWKGWGLEAQWPVQLLSLFMPAKPAPAKLPGRGENELLGQLYLFLNTEQTRLPKCTVPLTGCRVEAVPGSQQRVIQKMNVLFSFKIEGRQGPSQLLLGSKVFSFPPGPSLCSFPVFSIISHLCPIPPPP